MRHELRADSWNEKQRRRQYDDGSDGDAPWMSERYVEPYLVDVADFLEDDVPAFVHTAAQCPGTENGNESQCEDEGAREGEDHSVRHRPEQLARRAGQGIDR